MIYPEANPVAWSYKHNVKLATSTCQKCGKVVNVDRPVISKDFVGFESLEHECGSVYKIARLKPRLPEVQALTGVEA